MAASIHCPECGAVLGDTLPSKRAALVIAAAADPTAPATVLARRVGTSRATVHRMRQDVTALAAIENRKRERRDKASAIKELATAKLYRSVQVADPANDLDREFIGRALAIAVKTLEITGENESNPVTDSDRTAFAGWVKRVCLAAVRTAVANPDAARRYLARNVRTVVPPARLADPDV